MRTVAVLIAFLFSAGALAQADEVEGLLSLEEIGIDRNAHAVTDTSTGHFSGDAHSAASTDGCNISSDETLICEAVMCNPIGLVIPESHSECLQVNQRLAIYLLTLGFWEDPPKCKMRDTSCNRGGRVRGGDVADTDYCASLGTEQERGTCFGALSTHGMARNDGSVSFNWEQSRGDRWLAGRREVDHGPDSDAARMYNDIEGMTFEEWGAYCMNIPDAPLSELCSRELEAARAL